MHNHIWLKIIDWEILSYASSSTLYFCYWVGGLVVVSNCHSFEACKLVRVWDMMLQWWTEVPKSHSAGTYACVDAVDSVSLILDGCVEPENLCQIFNSFRLVWKSIFERVKGYFIVDHAAPETCASPFTIILDGGIEGQIGKFTVWSCLKLYHGVTLQVTAPRKVLSFDRDPMQMKLVEFTTSSSSSTSNLLTNKLCLFLQLQAVMAWGSSWLLLQVFLSTSRIPSRPQQRGTSGNFFSNKALFSSMLRHLFKWKKCLHFWNQLPASPAACLIVIVPFFTIIRAGSCQTKLCQILTLHHKLDYAVVARCQIGRQLLHQLSLIEEPPLQLTVSWAVDGGGRVKRDALKL